MACITSKGCVTMTTDQLSNQLSNIASQNTAKSQEFAREEMRFNAAEAQKNRDWQANQSATAHQREVLDLQKAGLNPVLSAGGSGAQTGSGATASGAKGETDNSVVPALASIIVNQQNNANQQAIAQIQRDATLEAARIHQATALQAANIQADASRFASINSANATRYASQMSYAGSRYASQMGYAGTKYSSNKSSGASRYAINVNSKTTKRGQNMSLIGSLAGSAAGLLGRIFG